MIGLFIVALRILQRTFISSAKLFSYALVSREATVLFVRIARLL